MTADLSWQRENMYLGINPSRTVVVKKLILKRRHTSTFQGAGRRFADYYWGGKPK
jgi:hypothetical protein